MLIGSAIVTFVGSFVQMAIALYFAYYNFCRVHQTLKTTPAVASGLTDHVWSVAELLEKAADC